MICECIHQCVNNHNTAKVYHIWTNYGNPYSLWTESFSLKKRIEIQVNSNAFYDNWACPDQLVKQFFSCKIDSILAVDFRYFYLNDIADVLTSSTLSTLSLAILEIWSNHTFPGDFDECTEGHDSCYFTIINFADFNFFYQHFDYSNAFVCRFHIRCCNVDQSFIVGVDLNTWISAMIRLMVFPPGRLSFWSCQGRSAWR